MHRRGSWAGDKTWSCREGYRSAVISSPAWIAQKTTGLSPQPQPTKFSYRSISSTTTNKEFSYIESVLFNIEASPRAGGTPPQVPHSAPLIKGACFRLTSSHRSRFGRTALDLAVIYRLRTAQLGYRPFPPLSGGPTLKSAIKKIKYKTKALPLLMKP